MIHPDRVTDILKEVGQTIIMPRWRNLAAGDIQQKSSPTDLVTIADTLTETALAPRLVELIPGSVVVGEEAHFADPSILQRVTNHTGAVWIVDPIDGTRAFASGSPQFGTIVALAQNGQTVAGWIYHPVTGDCLTTERGSGAWLRGKKLAVAGAQGDLFGLSGVRIDKWLRRNPHALPPQVKLLFEGSRPACHDYVRLLTGVPLFNEPWPSAQQAHFRVILERSKPWDDAAGILAVQEAGGVVQTLDDSDYLPDMFNIGILATANGDTNNLLRPLFQQVRRTLQQQQG